MIGETPGRDMCPLPPDVSVVPRDQKSRPTNIHRPRCWGDTDAQIRAAGILGYAIQEKLHAIKWYDEVYSELASHDKRLGPRRATDIFP